MLLMQGKLCTVSRDSGPSSNSVGNCDATCATIDASGQSLNGLRTSESPWDWLPCWGCPKRFLLLSCPNFTAQGA